MTERIERVLFTPQMLLYALAYRLIGKSYSYQLGQKSIRSTEKRTLGQRVFILLFPFVTLGIVGFVLLATWAVTFIQFGYRPDPLYYIQTAPLWHQLSWWIGLVCILYANLSVYKFPLIIKIIIQEWRHQQPDHGKQYQGQRDRHQPRS